MSHLSQDEITAEWIEQVAVGGAVLGGGGGGSLDEGIKVGRTAVESGSPTIISLNALDSSDIILTVSAVGAPAATESHIQPEDYVRTVKLMVDRIKDRNQTVGAIMTNEMGGLASVNGMLQSAVTGIPLVDAACNGRAHPTGLMGSIGLSQDASSLQAAVGGEPGSHRRLEIVVDSTLKTAASTVRSAAEDAGGSVAVARNPVDVSYAADHAAVGIYNQAASVGRAVLEATTGTEAAKRVADVVGGEVVTRGSVDSYSLETAGGFNVGTIIIDEEEMTFCNEYMTLDIDGERTWTFPDLITTLDAETGRPISTAQISEKRDISVVAAPASNLSLGAGMEDPSLYDQVQKMVEEPIVNHAFPAEG